VTIATTTTTATIEV